MSSTVIRERRRMLRYRNVLIRQTVQIKSKSRTVIKAKIVKTFVRSVPVGRCYSPVSLLAVQWQTA